MLRLDQIQVGVTYAGNEVARLFQSHQDPSLGLDLGQGLVLGQKLSLGRKLALVLILEVNLWYLESCGTMADRR